MAIISSKIHAETQFSNLKEINLMNVRKEIDMLLVDDERLECAFHTIRDQVIFTNKRIIVVNVQGVTGKRISYFSYPFAKVQYFGFQTAGLLDIDSELILAFSNGSKLQLEFRSKVDVHKLSTIISKYALIA